MKRLVVWFSCGAASAVAAKLCLAQYSGEYEIAIARCVVANEHPDNDRFAADCEQWLGQEILSLKSEKYADCWEVWERRKFLVSPQGAPCTEAMKKSVRRSFECAWWPDLQAYGYTVEERERASRFCAHNPDVELVTPLIDGMLTKSDCLSMIERAGIDLPAMYRLGFNNNNCVGCVKGGKGYWNRIRRVFPDVFERMAQLERSLGATIFRTDDAPLYLDELPADAGRHVEPEIDCSLFCFGAEQQYAECRAVAAGEGE